MSLNVSAIGDGKAQVLQPHSVRALLASLVSASSILAMALVAFLLVRVSPKLAIVIRHRQHLARDAPPALLRSKALVVLRTMLQPLDCTVLDAVGIEAVMFLHYLRSLCLLFGCLAIWVTPSIACFNALAASKPASNDWLNMLSWANLSTKDARLYWLRGRD
ncbi:hypothetical protein LTR70_010633 [Exophiala xenobiotica]|uniref:CSC1/OSCA1-like N-terminal transmembrane domain-containing protein n=1 Tax=Lithohypha guttulata TaxID=1690604 RepID=A0ABR0JTX1_9EURO|nr:hypothetical protein LTR24_010471 [Lithohypha guttulata]KAK5309072.1 hypothetical protein LTR70_010633 [Exophiala xenobiotica]